MPEPIWVANYNDGGHISNSEIFGAKSKYTDIDRSKLKSFELYLDGKLIITLHLEPGQRLIYRRRATKNIMGNENTAVHLVGWQKTINGSNVQSIAYIFEDGHIELAGQWNNKHAWFYEPKLMEEEIQ
jgi:hypothetical protein